MRVSNIGFVVVVALCPAVLSLDGCGSTVSTFMPGSSGSGGSSGGSGSGGGSSGSSVPGSDGGGNCVVCGSSSGSSSGGADSGPPVPPPLAVGTVTTADCMGCKFPPLTATACAASAPPITIVYPSDNVLVPPNMGIISVQWTPQGAPYTTFEVDFESGANTDWRIITSCTGIQTTDMQTQPPTASGGCDLPIDNASWSFLANQNAGGNPVQVTVRGSTDGNCATKSTNTINLNFAQDDLLGTYYYWKSTVSANGVGGQIWAKVFGDPNTAERDVTTAAIQNATCNGCHSLSRDGSRMVVYSDDDDSDDEYSDVAGSELNMTTMPNATELAGGVTGVRMGGQPPGFTTIDPTAGLYVTSNGFPCAGGGACGTSNGYGRGAAVPNNGFSLWNGQTAAFQSGVTIGATGTRPTMPDWSPDGASVVYVLPQAVATWDARGTAGGAGARNDDAHIFGGSLYTVPYQGGGAFGNAAVFLMSGGENNYYPSYSPDVPMSYIIFNRAPMDNSAGGLTNCNNGFCPNDSFSNPAARLMLIGATAVNGTPIDLEKANGSPAANAIPWSNSYPRWAPFIQTYKGSKLLWFTFSSTRDYGLRILNHKAGMYQCYPADATETPGAAHQAPFVPQCQEPQLWMAPITIAEGGGSRDPSFPAFWLPYQDPVTHNHTAQWTQQVGITPPPTTGCTCSMLGGACGALNACGCCGPTTTPKGNAGVACSGNNVCIQPVN